MIEMEPDELRKFSEKIPKQHRNIYCVYDEDTNTAERVESLADVELGDEFCIYNDEYSKINWFVATSNPYLNEYYVPTIKCKKIKPKHSSSIKKC